MSRFLVYLIRQSLCCGVSRSEIDSSGWGGWGGGGSRADGCTAGGGQDRGQGEAVRAPRGPSRSVPVWETVELFRGSYKCKCAARTPSVFLVEPAEAGLAYHPLEAPALLENAGPAASLTVFRKRRGWQCPAAGKPTRAGCSPALCKQPLVPAPRQCRENVGSRVPLIPGPVTGRRR